MLSQLEHKSSQKSCIAPQKVETVIPHFVDHGHREGPGALKHQKRQKKVNKNLLAPLAVYGGRQTGNTSKGKKLPELFTGNQVRANHQKAEGTDLLRHTLPPKPSQMGQGPVEQMYPLAAKTMVSKDIDSAEHQAMVALQS